MDILNYKPSTKIGDDFLKKYNSSSKYVLNKFSNGKNYISDTFNTGIESVNNTKEKIKKKAHSVSNAAGNVASNIKNKLPSGQTVKSFLFKLLLFIFVVVVAVTVTLIILQKKSIIPNFYTSTYDVEAKINLLQTENITDLKNLIAKLTDNINKAINDGINMQELLNNDTTLLQSLQTQQANDISNIKELINTNAIYIKNLHVDDMAKLTSMINDNTTMMNSIQSSEKNDINILTTKLNTTVDSLNNLISQESTDIDLINQKYDNINKILTSLSTSLSTYDSTISSLDSREKDDIAKIQVQITNIQNNNKLIPQPLNVTSNISGWNGPYMITFPKLTNKHDPSLLNIDPLCLDSSVTDISKGPEIRSVGKLNKCSNTNNNEMYYYNTVTGQLYNVGTEKCLSVGDGIKPTASWVSCDNNSSIQKFNLNSNRLQYLDSAALDMGSTYSQYSMNTILATANSANYPYQYVNFVYSGV